MVIRRQRELIDLLLEKSMVQQEQVEAARAETKKTGVRLDVALECMGFISSEDIAKLQAEIIGVPYMDISDYNVDEEIVKLLP